MFRAITKEKCTFKLEIILRYEESPKPTRHVPNRLVRLDLVPDVLLCLIQSVLNLSKDIPPTLRNSLRLGKQG